MFGRVVMSLKSKKGNRVKNVRVVPEERVVHSLRAVLVMESVDKDLNKPDLSQYDIWDHKFFGLCKKARVDAFFKLGVSVVEEGDKDYLQKIASPSYIIQSKYGKAKVYINPFVLHKTIKDFGDKVIELRKRYKIDRGDSDGKAKKT